MKKIITVLCILLVLTGCEKEPTTKHMECKIKTVVEGITLDGNYEINYTDNFVDNVKFTETYTVENESLVEAAEEAFDSIYSEPNKLEHYNYTRETNNLSVTSTVKIDYTKLNIEEYVKINDSIKNAVKDGKIDANTLINGYKSNGASCKEK